MSCPTYCATAFPEHEINECNQTVAGGGINVVLFRCDATSVENSDYTTSNIEADIANGKATMVKRITATSDQPAANANSASYVMGQEPKTKNYTETITLMDENVSGANDAAYAQLNSSNGTEIAAVLVDNFEEENVCILHESTAAYILSGGLVNPGDSAAHYSFTIVGKSKTGPKTVARPVGLFE